MIEDTIHQNNEQDALETTVGRVLHTLEVLTIFIRYVVTGKD